MGETRFEGYGFRRARDSLASMGCVARDRFWRWPFGSSVACEARALVTSIWRCVRYGHERSEGLWRWLMVAAGTRVWLLGVEPGSGAIA